MTVSVTFNVIATQCEEMNITVLQQAYDQNSPEMQMQPVFNGMTTNCILDFVQTFSNGPSFFYYNASNTAVTMQGAFNYMG